MTRMPGLALLAAASDDAAERRVICAVLCESDKLAMAADLEVRDFTNPRFGAVLGAIRNLVARDAHVGAVEVIDELEREARERGVSPPDRVWMRWFCEVLGATSTYEDVFGPAALHVFEADVRLLRKIRIAREAVMRREAA